MTLAVVGDVAHIRQTTTIRINIDQIQHTPPPNDPQYRTHLTLICARGPKQTVCTHERPRSQYILRHNGTSASI